MSKRRFVESTNYFGAVSTPAQKKLREEGNRRSFRMPPVRRRHHKGASRRHRGSRGGYTRRINRAAQSSGVGTVILNPVRQRSLRTSRTMIAYGGAQVGAITPLALYFHFDPAGTYDTNGTVMPDWNNFIGLFNMYKVNKIIVEAIVQGSSLSQDSVQIYGRHWYSTQALVATLPMVTEADRVKLHTYSTEHPSARWEIIPKIPSEVVTPGLLAAQGVAWHRCGWLSTTSSAPIYGFMGFVPTIPVGMTMTFNVTFDISFSSQK